MARPQHLWEVDHPYYMEEGCFYKGGHHHEYESFAEFVEEWGDHDDNRNLVFRWDWTKPDCTEPGEFAGHDQLHVFFVMQRKAYTVSCTVTVTEADEPAVLKYLTPKARKIATLWEPIWEGGAA